MKINVSIKRIYDIILLRLIDRREDMKKEKKSFLPVDFIENDTWWVHCYGSTYSSHFKKILSEKEAKLAYKYFLKRIGEYKPELEKYFTCEREIVKY
jgi:hypothetical protein